MCEVEQFHAAEPAEPAAVQPEPRAHWSAWPFIALIWVYRFTLGPLMGGQCRFWPTCSEYGLEAYRLHGSVRGTFLTARRVLRCHPWGGHGVDPVPPPAPKESTRK